jgi:hypothetical protein
MRCVPVPARFFTHMIRPRDSCEYGVRSRSSPGGRHPLESCLLAFSPPIKSSAKFTTTHTHSFRDQLTLEVGKCQIADGRTRRSTCGRHVPRSAPPSAIIEFASSPSCRWSLNRAVLDDGRQHGEQEQGARARPALGDCATRPGHAVNMFHEGRRCKRQPGAASMQLHGCARHCGQLCQSLRALKPCVPLAPSQPHSRRVMPGPV